MATSEPPAKKQKTSNGEISDVASDFINKVNERRKKTAKSVTEFKFNKKRVRVLSKEKDVPDECEGIVYWMSRDQRVQGWFCLFVFNVAFKHLRSYDKGACLQQWYFD